MKDQEKKALSRTSKLNADLREVVIAEGGRMSTDDYKRMLKKVEGYVDSKGLQRQKRELEREREAAQAQRSQAIEESKQRRKGRP